MSSDLQAVFFEPILKETIWGGNRLSEYGFDTNGKKCGEAWVISAHKNGDCLIKGAGNESSTLSRFWKEHPEFFGKSEAETKNKPFPLLTKIIDAKSDLSIQVHPDDDYAKKNENGSLGKTECWYILDALPGTKIVIGHRGKSPEETAKMIRQGLWKDFIREIPVKKGDFFYIKPGTVHAIKGGTLILETQQSSDVTYRVYDYDRLSNGKPRELHVQQSIDVIVSPFIEEETPKQTSKTANKNLRQLLSCDKFTVWKADVNGELELCQDQKYILCTVVEGMGEINQVKIKKGDSFILGNDFGKAEFKGQMELILSSE
ncbi:MAG: mannose-6-phosphate isomerase, class I [Treponema sp.]|nr:mannose-6-phosphate isomerase, class I [Treponema sp.]